MVKPGAAALLQKLKITPFSFGIDVHQVYNGGFVYGADLLEMTDRDVLSKFAVGINKKKKKKELYSYYSGFKLKKAEVFVH